MQTLGAKDTKYAFGQLFAFGKRLVELRPILLNQPKSASWFE